MGIWIMASLRLEKLVGRFPGMRGRFHLVGLLPFVTIVEKRLNVLICHTNTASDL